MTTAFDCTNLDEFLVQYGPALGQATQDVMAPLHTPGQDAIDWLPTFGRKPFEAQAHVIAAGAKVLNRQSALILVGEMGTGKTLMGQAIVHTHASHQQPGRSARRTAKRRGTSALGQRIQPHYRAIVMCPPQLVEKWAREIRDTIPFARITMVEHWSDVFRLDPTVPPSGAEWFVIGRETAKLSSTWTAATPRRGLALDGGLLARIKRACAKGRRQPWMERYIDRDNEIVGWLGEQRWAPGVRCPRCGFILTDEDGVPIEPEKFAKTRKACERKIERPTPADPFRTVLCGERLWQDFPKPRRYSPARFIKQQLPGYFDYFLIDEAHEMKGEGEVQAEAAGYIATAARHTIALTGTLIGGYAWHVRTLLFRIGLGQAVLDLGLGWKDSMSFNERFGRIETRITERTDGACEDDRTGEVEEAHKTARGGKRRSCTKSVKPGIVPTLFGQVLVSNCIFLGLKEVSDQLPEYFEEVIPVEMDVVQAGNYKVVADRLGEALKEMLRIGDKRLLGTMLQVLLCYPDYPFRWSTVGYRDRHGWVGVVTPASMSEGHVYPKETALVERVQKELAEGRKCWIYSTFTDKRDCLARLEAQLGAAGIKATILRPKVEPKKREAWIAANGPKYDVILSHPELVKTGLDFFDRHKTYNFPTIIFYGTGYNLFTLQQASRRAWRIGQGRECRVLYFYYEGTMQERAMKLMGQKATAAEALNGRFSSEGLTALAGEDDNMEMALAKSLADKTKVEGGEGLRAWAKLTATLDSRKEAKAVSADKLAEARGRLAAMRDKYRQPKLYKA